MSNTQRNGTIDLWRFLFSLLIICSHLILTPSCFNGNMTWFKGASIGVEFFFIVSGFLMARSSIRDLPTGQATAKFITRKYLAILPTYIFAYIISFIVKAAINSFEYGTLFGGSILELLMLQNMGLTGFFDTPVPIVSASWYISAMMISLFVLFPLMYSKRDIFLNIIAPMACIFIFAYFAVTEGSLKFESGIKSLLRATSLICLGCVSYQICEKIKNITPTLVFKILLTVVEFTGYIRIFFLAWEYKRGEWDFIAALMLAISITISFSGLSLSGKMFKGAFYAWLGKLSLALYLNHYIWITLLMNLNMPLSRQLEWTLVIVLTFTSSLLCVFLTELLAETWHRYGSKFKSLFVKENT